MGTFKAHYVTFSQNGVITFGGGDWRIGPTTSQGSVSYVLTTIELDGGPPIKFNELPAGFRPLSNAIISQVGQTNGLCGGVASGNIVVGPPTNNVARSNITFGVFGPGVYICGVGCFSGLGTQGPFIGGANYNATSLLANINCDLSLYVPEATGAAVAYVYQSLDINGTYDLLSSSFSWEVQNSSTPIHLLANSIINNGGNLADGSGVIKRTISRPGINPTSFNGNDVITVISPASSNPSNLTPLNLLGITAWYLNIFPNPANPTSGAPPPLIPFTPNLPFLTFIPITPEFIDNWTPTEFKFIIPPTIYPVIIDYWINNPVPLPIPVEIIVVGDGTQFSGSVSLGILYILLEDASGIYVIDENQTVDTLYFRGGYTTDFNILPINPPWSDEFINEDDFYSLLQFPYKILSQSYLEDEVDEEGIFITSVLRTVVITEDVEIPSPFIQTAFVP
jgi:hypothetical protein